MVTIYRKKWSDGNHSFWTLNKYQLKRVITFYEADGPDAPTGIIEEKEVTEKELKLILGKF